MNLHYYELDWHCICLRQSSEHLTENMNNQNQVFKPILTPNQTQRFIYQLSPHDCKAKGFFLSKHPSVFSNRHGRPAPLVIHVQFTGSPLPTNVQFYQPSFYIRRLKLTPEIFLSISMSFVRETYFPNQCPLE